LALAQTLQNSQAITVSVYGACHAPLRRALDGTLNRRAADRVESVDRKSLSGSSRAAAAPSLTVLARADEVIE
jgi:hypothetical protein